MNAPETNYLRARITGVLVVASPLHIGSGEAAENGAVLVNAVSKDALDRPYLVATTLRGALRARLSDTQLTESLFGTARGNTGNMGKLRLYDAVVTTGSKCETILRSGTSINPLLGVAETHELHTREIVPVGSCFELTLEADRINSAELATVIGLLETFNGGIASGVGTGNSSRDQGRLSWQCDCVDVIDAARLEAWLKADSAELPWSRLKECQADCSKNADAIAATTFEIEFDTPWLINAPELRRETSDEEEHPPDLEFSRTHDGRAWLPASSLKGWLRGRARRILMTLYVGGGLSPPLASENADTLLPRIFGSSDQAGWLMVPDAYSNQRVPEHRQQFIAIDRFTGGNSHGALYYANASSPCAVSGEIGWKKPPKPDGDWRLALLAMVVRDAMEGDLVLGWGKARGYGQGKARIRVPGQPQLCDWPALFDWLSSAGNLQLHIEALNQLLNGSNTEANHD